MAETRYLVLARKWRPQRFEDVVGQEHITRTLKNAITSGRIHHAFLFIGSRGIGKTTTARILAKALNCLSSDVPTVSPCDTCENCVSISAGTNLDIIEIDGASNNGVDHVREIRENIRMVPTHGRYKVYIIDEVHQLSTGAFNALLKTLEEPPPHAIFILATTEAHKIPATIVSRCQRYDFRRVAISNIVTLLRGILEAEGRTATDEALQAIARAAEGGVRDSESILDELLTYCEGEITFKEVFDVLGLVDWAVMHRLCEAILAKDIALQLAIVEEVVAAGKDLSQFVQDILRYFRNLLVCKSANTGDLIELPEEERRELFERAQRFTLSQLIRLVEQFAELTRGFDSQLAQRIALEAQLIKVSKVGVEVSLDTILEKLAMLGDGAAVPGAPSAAPPRTGPPDPPPAGPAEAARPAPAPRKRMTVSPAALERQWADIVEAVAAESLSLKVWLGQAVAAGIEEGTLLLEFPAASSHARGVIEKPDNRGAIEMVLRDVTENVRAFRTSLTAATGAEPAALQVDSGLPFYPGVSPDAARAALEDPAIQQVVEVFRGRIAAVRAPEAAAE